MILVSIQSKEKKNVEFFPCYKPVNIEFELSDLHSLDFSILVLRRNVCNCLQGMTLNENRF